MTDAEEIRTVAMTVDLRTGISAARAMVIEMVTAHNRDRDHVDLSKIEDHNKTVDLSNNRVKDPNKKIADLDKVKDLVDHNKIEGHNKTVDHSNNKDLVDHNKIEDRNNRDLVGHALHNKDLKILHRLHHQRKDKP